MLIVTPEHKQPPPQHHPFRFKPQKALEALLYLANRMEPKKRSRYFLNKLFFFSDLHHLDQYSRYIAGDFYVAMEEGPVPSNAYNMMKEMAGMVGKEFGLPYEESFSVKKRTYLEFYDPRRDADLDVLSPSDIECLNYALERYGRLSKEEMEKIVHDDPAYVSVVKEKGLNKSMDVLYFARFLEDGQDLMNRLTGEV